MNLLRENPHFHTLLKENVLLGITGFGHSSWKISELKSNDVKRKIVMLDPKVPSQTLTVSIKYYQL